MNHPLAPLHFTPLPLGAIRPRGWLAAQLRLQADGLSGHLDEFWPDVAESRWFGGEAEGWERAPYWLDGVIPLAFTLDDAALQAKVRRYVACILERQHPDGWLGPREMAGPGGRDPHARHDAWSQFLILKALAQYHEATADPRVLPAMTRAFQSLDRAIDRTPLFDWGQFRWFEALLPLYWLYERQPEPWLLELAVKLRAQGFDWSAFFAHWPLTAPTPPGRWNFMGHVVNNAMAPKAPALWARFTGEPADRAAVYAILEQLEQHHGMVTGVISGDECLAGKRPTQGTELCAVVEFAYSLEMLLALLGDAAFGDRLEKVIFNALPATFSADMWAHQYDQQVNQIECSACEGRTWNTNGPESNLFGLEPNYGCCTANLSQGWPKFAAHLWMRSADGGVAATAYAPSCASVEIAGTPVRLTLETDYPFREALTLRVETPDAVEFPLWLRVPAWAAGATLQVADEAPRAIPAGGFYCERRVWRGPTEVRLHFPMRMRLLRGYRDAVAIERGPLVYALPIGADWRRVHADRPHRELPHADWEVYPTTPWNYALDWESAITFAEHPLGARPFSPEGAPVSATVRGRRLPAWQAENGSAADAPLSPVESAEPLETLTLIPYGCTHLRITEFPTLKPTR